MSHTPVEFYLQEFQRRRYLLIPMVDPVGVLLVIPHESNPNACSETVRCFGDIHVGLDSRTPCWDDASEGDT